ncbi:MAG: hydroxymethylglutaryl-CoA lyase [Deltaproteobacteria bacterium]|nr:hydroxymethylglutaryl-CoA lyase [Deltaproteobacteria bacterium]
MAERIDVYEVGPRDGLQNETAVLATDQKLALIARLVGAGLRRMEATSFVSPKAMPQMADAAEVTRGAALAWPDGRFSALVLSELGYDRAIAAGCRSVAVVVIASESLSRRNSRIGVEGGLGVGRRLLERARRDGVRTRAYLSAAWACPYEGPVPAGRATALAERIWEAGPDELAIADSVGHAEPLEVGRLLEDLGRRLGMDRLAVHLHDTQALGLANAAAAIAAGVRTVDASIGGLGGCPFAAGAAGNLATEDLVFLAHKMGFETGVDLGRLWEAVAWLDDVVGRRVGGRTRVWWENRGRFGEPCGARCR